MKESLSLNSKLITVMVIFCVWCSIYYLNEWLFSQFILFEDFISRVFLPAAIRGLAALLAGWVGIEGDFFLVC
jgi:hypothetical protein